jgi:hypothetical protein
VARLCTLSNSVLLLYCCYTLESKQHLLNFPRHLELNISINLTLNHVTLNFRLITALYEPNMNYVYGVLCLFCFLLIDVVYGQKVSVVRMEV